jgi:hypothetical protein
MDAYHRVLEFWWKTGWPVITADSNTDIFSLAQARNNAVAKAKTSVVVICDADTIPVMANIRAAVADPAGICWPFLHYRVISTDYLDTPFPKLAGVPYINAWDGDGINGVGGCLVCTVKEYWRLGGQPPEFIGWGFEDTAFTCIVETLSTVKRLPGNIYAFEHNTHADDYLGAKADSPGWDRDLTRNKNLLAPYQNARGRAWLMRELLRRRDNGAMSPYIGHAAPGAPPRHDPNDPALIGRYRQGATWLPPR